MAEDNDGKPIEIDPAELRGDLADMGPLTPNVAHGDYDDPMWDRSGGYWELTGAGAQEIQGFEPTRHELCVLVKYWMTQIIEYNFDYFCDEVGCSIGSRRWAFGNRRINRMETVLGKDAVTRAINEAYEEYGRERERAGNSEAWRIFRHGTEDERRAFREKYEADLRAFEQASEDRFHVSLLRFPAGEPHDIQPGTVGAEIANRVVKENPALAAPESREMLLNAIRESEIPGRAIEFDTTIQAIIDRQNDKS